MRVLITSENHGSVQQLAQKLTSLGYEVQLAHSTEETRTLLHQYPEIQMVILDTEQDPSEAVKLGRFIKLFDWNRYVYVLLIPEKNKIPQTEAGCENSGFDDILTRPFERRELKSRLAAGLKIIHLQEKIRETQKIQQGELKSGREAQSRLIPLHFADIPKMETAARFIPSGNVSGDLHDIFRIDETHVGLYSIDVSGHGVAAALFSVGLRQRLSTQIQPSSLIKVSIESPPFYRINSPERVLEALDKDDLLGKYGRYFTMVYAVVDLPEKQIAYCRAGHNMPLIIQKDGNSKFLEGGGPPLGLGLASGSRIRQTYRIFPGDTFILFSDGINEAFSRSGQYDYGLQRVQDILSRHQNRTLEESFDALIADVKEYQGRSEFNDDISIIGFRCRDV